MTAIVTVFEAAGLTVSENKTETMLLRTLNQMLEISPLVVEAAGQRYIDYIYTDDAVSAPERCYRHKHRHHARDQTTVPTRVGMLRSFQARAVRYRGTPVHVTGSPTKDQRDGDPAVRACDLGSRPGAIR